MQKKEYRTEPQREPDMVCILSTIGMGDNAENFRNNPLFFRVIGRIPIIHFPLLFLFSSASPICSVRNNSSKCCSSLVRIAQLSAKFRLCLHSLRMRSVNTLLLNIPTSLGGPWIVSALRCPSRVSIL